VISVLGLANCAETGALLQSAIGRSAQKINDLSAFSRPGTELCVRFAGASDHGSKAGARHQRCTQADQVRRFDLAIENFEVVSDQLLAQAKHGSLGGVGLAAEHGFTEKGPADRQAVQPAFEAAGTPDLNRVRPTLLVQVCICARHLGRNPGPLLSASFFGAGGNDVVKCLIETDVEMAMG
jgi:hypothetical protein